MKLSHVAAAVLVAGTITAGFQSPAGAQEQARMLTSPIGSMVNTVGTAISSVVSRETDVQIGTSAMAGPQVLLPQANNAAGAFTLLNAADAYQALRGIAPAYRAKHLNLRLVSFGFSNPLGVIVPDDSEIRTGADLKGKRVTGVFSAHKTCQQLATAQLANFGLDWDDVDVTPVTHSKQAAVAIAEGRADAALCVPVGQAVVKEVNAQVPIRFISMNDSADAVTRTRKHFPAGGIQYFKSGSSEGVRSDVAVWSYPFYLIVNADTSDDLVYTMAKTVHDNVDALRKISPIFRSWEPDRMAQTDATIPFHPGAVRFYQEIGIWTDEMGKELQALNQEVENLASN